MLRFIIGLLFIGLLSACTPPPDDETQLRSQLEALLQAARDHKVDTLMALLSEDFRGEGQQPIDRKATRQFIAYHFLRNPTVHILASNIAIDLLPPTARINLDVAVAGGSGVLPERGQIYHLTTEWQKRDAGWLLTHARWQGQL
jgi:hypothetical protein